MPKHTKYRTETEPEAEAVTPEAVTPEAVTPEAVTPEAVTPEAVTPEATRYHVMPGKAITTKRGVIATERDAQIFAEIKPEHVNGGRDTLEGLVASGHVGRG